MNLAQWYAVNQAEVQNRGSRENMLPIAALKFRTDRTEIRANCFGIFRKMHCDSASVVLVRNSSTWVFKASAFPVDFACTFTW